MMIPSIDIRNGRAVQLKNGKEFLFDGGDPIERLKEFSVIGEVAVIDLDAAMGTGDNTELIKKMCQIAKIRVGGGVRSQSQLADWLDAGAAKVIVGTMASPDFFEGFPRERLMAAVDSSNDFVVTHGWQNQTRVLFKDKVDELKRHVGGILLTNVNTEGTLSGLCPTFLSQMETNDAFKICVAGGTNAASEIGNLDKQGIDVQVGVALYNKTISLSDAVTSCLKPSEAENGLWPTVVLNELGDFLGLVYSNAESLKLSIDERRGIFFSRSRNKIWRKGETSGNSQVLKQIQLDCDRDTLIFRVQQSGPFCHTGTFSCSGQHFSMEVLENRLNKRIHDNNENSYTKTVASSDSHLAAKLREEAEELIQASAQRDITHEAADLIYFLSLKLVQGRVRWADVMAELEKRFLFPKVKPKITKGKSYA